MPSVIEIREALPADTPHLALLRAEDWGKPEYWADRINGYLARTHHPQHALEDRVVFVAKSGGRIVGLIAGHLTTRFGCDGEIQWISVAVQSRRATIGSELVIALAKWFVDRDANRICVDVDPDNPAARKFYCALGAAPLNEHWMQWDEIGKLLEPE